MVLLPPIARVPPASTVTLPEPLMAPVATQMGEFMINAALLVMLPVPMVPETVPLPSCTVPPWITIGPGSVLVVRMNRLSVLLLVRLPVPIWPGPLKV